MKARSSTIGPSKVAVLIFARKDHAGEGDPGQYSLVEIGAPEFGFLEIASREPGTGEIGALPFGSGK